jgi:hypothetical protein
MSQPAKPAERDSLPQSVELPKIKEITPVVPSRDRLRSLRSLVMTFSNCQVTRRISINLFWFSNDLGGLFWGSKNWIWSKIPFITWFLSTGFEFWLDYFLIFLSRPILSGVIWAKGVRCRGGPSLPAMLRGCSCTPARRPHLPLTAFTGQAEALSHKWERGKTKWGFTWRSYSGRI